MNLDDLSNDPEDIRGFIRRGEYTGTTAGLAPGIVQANLVILRSELAYDFMLFCQRNPKPCPLLEVTDSGDRRPKRFAPGADISYDLPKYRVYREGELEAEVPNIAEYWRDDFVAFLLGCSFSFEKALINAGIRMRHVDEGSTVPMFVTNIATDPAGSLSGPLVVSMRPIPADKVVRCIQITSRFPGLHGAPVHVGDPAAIGIKDVNYPEFGEGVEIKDGEVPVFWACGVTPQAVAMKSKPALMITHSPGHMFITDVKDEELALF